MSTHPRGARRARRTALIGAALATVLALAACGGGTDADGEPTATEPTANDVAGPDVLRLAIGSPTSGSDVLMLALSTDAYIWSGLYDRMLTLGPDGSPQPSAATSWEWSEDQLTLTFHLRDDMVFRNGDPVTAHDAAATFLYMRDNLGTHQRGFERVSQITALDDHTLEFQFSELDINFLRIMSVAGVIVHRDYIDHEDAAMNPMGSGPYELDTEATVQGSLWVLNRRDDHWNADAYPFPQITIQFIEDSTARENALQSGQIDADSIQTGSLAQFQDNPDFTVTTIDATSTFNLMIQDRDGEIIPALGDVRVRQAINLALNREGLTAAIGQGSGMPTSQQVMPGTSAHDPALDDYWDFDLERARALMAEAGYADGFDLPMPSIFFLQSFDPIIASSLGEIGIRVAWEPVPPADTGTVMTSGDFAVMPWVDGQTDPTELISLNFLPTGPMNPQGSTTPELEALLERFTSTVDTEERNQVIREISRYAVENAWNAPVMHFAQNFVTTAGIEYVGTAQNNIPSVSLFQLAD